MKVMRACALALSLVMAAGALPAGGGYRCAAMGRVVASRKCCPSDDATTRIGERCCDPLPARALEARAGAPTVEHAVAPSIVASSVDVLPPPAPVADLGRAARSRGSPGDRRHRFSAILRV